ncbi:MAG: cytochrome c biogenesis protein CcsA [Planctomycetes bacterium]|nr:cytochrome c biogenesis protein CcsA [Planctomycetota bacterium]
MLRQATFLLAAFVAPALVGAAELPSNFDLTALRELPVQHDGRWPPLDTVARDVVKSVTGVSHGNDDGALLRLLAWTFDPQSWMSEPLIRIANAELRGELRLPPNKTVFSFAELSTHAPLTDLRKDLARADRSRKLDPLQSKVSDIHEKLGLLQRVFSGQVIRPIPDPKDMLGAWLPIAAAQANDSEESKKVTAAWDSLRKAFVAGDGAAFAEASQRLTTSLAGLPAAYRPLPRLIATELHYNRLQPYRSAWRMMAVGTLLALAAMFVRRKWFDGLAALPMVAGFVLVSYGLWLRWDIAGRIPASNMFESLLFLGWGVGVFAILSILAFPQRLVPLTASGMSAVALLLADVLPVDHFIRPIAPVLLDTVWMSIHVPIIMVSYSVLALAVFIAHIQLVVLAVSPGRQRVSEAIDSLHYWYVHVGSILLAAGIITGSMWAAASWGRYWGWDPKEVWSLVALLGYLTILHVRVDRLRPPAWAIAAGVALTVALMWLAAPKIGLLSGARLPAAAATVLAMVVLVAARGRFATAVKSILCFWLIIMTYVGVNYVLGTGLHSYGFGTGAVVRYMFLIGGVDLALVGLCTVVFVARRGWRLTLPQIAPLGMAPA